MPIVKKVSTSSTYRDVLKRAFTTIIKNKFLWFFGFFAAFLGTAGEFEPLFKNYTNIGDRSRDILSLQSVYQDGILYSLYNTLDLFFSAYPWQAFLFLLMFFVIFIIVVWLAIVAQIALFDSAYKLDKGKSVRFGDGYRVGNKHFGSVLLINIVVKAVLYAIFVVIGAPLITWFLVKNTLLGGIIFIILVFVVFIPVSIIVSFIVKYAIAYIVIKEKHAGESVKLGWDLFKKNWLISIEMALLILAIGLGAGLVIVLGMGLTSVPFVILGMISFFINSSAGFSIAIVLGTITWFVLLAIVGSAFVAFQYTAWTFLFVKLTGQKAESKLTRLISKLSSKKISA